MSPRAGTPCLATFPSDSSFAKTRGEVYRPFAEGEFAKCPCSERQEDSQWAVSTESTSLVSGVRAKHSLFCPQTVVATGATSRNLFESAWQEIREAKVTRRLAS
jgi:hypothetical protein